MVLVDSISAPFASINQLQLIPSRSLLAGNVFLQFPHLGMTVVHLKTCSLSGYNLWALPNSVMPDESTSLADKELEAEASKGHVLLHPSLLECP